MENKPSSVKKLKMQALSVLQMSHSFKKSNDIAPIPSTLDHNFIGENQVRIDNEENFEEEQEFSFEYFGAPRTLTFADEIFDNGKIRPTFATFSLVATTTHDNNILSLQPPLKKLFVDEELSGFFSQSKGTSKRSCNETSQKITMVEVLTSNNKCKKSKSTSFSNIWRLHENMKLRSISDDKDAFVLLNPLGSMPMKSNEAKEETVVSKREKGEKFKTTFSPHEKLYMMNKKRNETSKWKSFLPYKANLIGVFTNVNGFSRIFSPF